jgi:hypothetical protein
MTGDEINFKQSHGATRFCVIVACFSWAVSKNGYIFISFVSIVTPNEVVAADRTCGILCSALPNLRPVLRSNRVHFSFEQQGSLERSKLLE